MILKENDVSNRILLKVEEDFDVVVVGAGLAGISAALTAARNGMKTALISDRPVLGGAASSEVRVGPGGADSHPFHWNRYARETGIMEEVYNHIYYRAQNAGKWRWFYFDQLYFDLVLNEPNISCYLNTSVYKVNKDSQDRMSSVEGIQQRSEKSIKFNGKIFVDCSGDGSVGFLSGADYRMGREAKEEFHEIFAPEEADKGTMGATLLFTTVDTGHPIKYAPPKWAIEFDRLDTLNRLKSMISKMPDGTFYGFWWAEYGGQLDSIHDDDKVIWHLRKLIYGIWNHIKNSGQYAGVENHEINWIGYLPGKRESRRLMGPYIATSIDFLTQKKFDDRIGYTGWPIDVHPPGGYLSTDPGPGCTHEYLPGISDIPFRCIYSRNISNLFFAGRNVSASHEGLGTLRLIQTTAVMGQAAGMAAAMCVEKSIFPDDIYISHMKELQRRLVRSDQSIVGYRLWEEEDFSRNAVAAMSSCRNYSLETVEKSMLMDKRYGVILPIRDEMVETLSFYLSSKSKQKVKLRVYSCVERPENYRVKEKLAEIEAEVNGEGWIDFEVNASAGSGKKIFVLFDKNISVKMYFTIKPMTGIAGMESDFEGDMLYDSKCVSINSEGHLTMLPCFKITGNQNMFDAANINNGFIRPCGLPNIWASAEMKPGRPEWAAIEFEEQKNVSRIELVFNTDLNTKCLKPVINHVAPQLIKNYELIALTDAGEVTVVSERENYKRFVTHKFAPVTANAFKLVVYETWGSEYAEVYDFRIYES